MIIYYVSTSTYLKGKTMAAETRSLPEFFRKFAHSASLIVGSAWAFLAALLLILIWGLTGPIFHFSDTWQLVINTGTTIITFLMVFLIQNSQNRDSKAIHLKLDELLKSIKNARTSMVNLEDLSDEELERIHNEFLQHKEIRQEQRSKKKENNKK